MKKFRFYLAFGLRICALILALPSSILISLSNLIKNKGDIFNF